MQKTIPATAKTLGLEVEEFPQYLDSDDVSKEIPRYVWFPGDIVSPRRKLETREMVGIAIQINGQTFHVTANGGDEFQTAARWKLRPTGFRRNCCHTAHLPSGAAQRIARRWPVACWLARNLSI